MQGAKNQMPSKRCLDTDLGCFRITHLTHHDDVRILPKNVAKRLGKAEFNFIHSGRPRIARLELRRHNYVTPTSYLELIRLLKEASEIEHSLMAQYLFFAVLLVFNHSQSLLTVK